ncbi:MAG: hypothetical protein R3E01_01975 [Pirellulaceae bacterium]
MSKRDEFVAQMQAKQEEWNAEIDELEAKARKQKAQTTADHHARLAELKGKRDEAAEKLQEVRNASEDAWESLKSGAEQIWDDLKQTFQKAKKAFSE